MRYEIRFDGAKWGVRLDQELVGQHATQQQAVDWAKRRAAVEGIPVVWEDRDGDIHGPVIPSKFGWFSEVSVRERLGSELNRGLPNGRAASDL